MRKLIEVKSDALTLKCDNINCNYEHPDSIPYEESALWVGEKCPKCKASLLTLDDYERWLIVQKTVKFINRWFSWLTIFMRKNQELSEVSVSVHKQIKIQKK